MPIAQFRSKLSEITKLSDKFYFLHLELTEPDRIEFKAGQYLLLNCPLTPQKRQYSIVSAPRLDHGVELLIEQIPNGVASGYLTSLKPGDEVSFFAAAGEFTIADDVLAADTPLVFIGTGSGLAPLRSMILDLLRTKESKRPITLYWGMRFATDLFWLEYFEELQDTFPNFQFHVVLSKAPEEWTLCRGRVTDCLNVHDLPAKAQYYLCGNSTMISDVISVLTKRGVDTNAIHHEKFI